MGREKGKDTLVAQAAPSKATQNESLKACSTMEYPVKSLWLHMINYLAISIHNFILILFIIDLYILNILIAWWQILLIYLY